MTRLPMIALSLFVCAAPALAQTAPTALTGPDNEKVNLVIVYGDDPCPQATGEELVVCGRKEEKDRYRIPEPLRGDPNAPANQAWGEQYRSLEYVGRSGIDSCTPSGIGGFTGCFQKLARAAKEEKRQADNASWADLVAAERARRLSTIDADSEAIEARVKAEEAARAAAAPPN
ncbi:hypothetical protein [Sphingobium algorifonticola]|uniref:DUF2799 domain-containing protein n=1 Tax=Sphingobium algorifonticola TaxID=2008318 RepID=A0A437J8Q5_9SPHN|nr:hypothetical protein [Sphingobium algorifonticola]RVT41876.1 hypothetical protein ENE74_06325 [Sphingobium algorifonticola]